MPYTYSYHEVTPAHRDEIGAIDLGEEWQNAKDAGMPVHYYHIHIDGQGNSASALYLPMAGRVGIEWGADADWADYDDIDQAISDYLNDSDTYESRN